jgi:4'-phosphopantetheinyl transferase
MATLPAAGTAEVRLSPLPALPFGSAWALLSGNERERAERYTHPKARESYVGGRALARVLLGCACDAHPRDVVIAVRGGKPYLPLHPTLHFSMSRSSGWAAFAIAAEPVGVDIELSDAERPVEAIAAQLLHTGERELLAEATGRAHCRMFYRIWTQKEAVAKGLGRGFRLPFRTFRVGPAGGKVHFDTAPAGEPQWFSVTFDAIPNMILSLAIPRREPRVRFLLDTPSAFRNVPRHERRHASAHA